MESNAAEALQLYSGYLDKYILEVNRSLTKEQIVADMNIYPIMFEGVVAGIVGINTSESPWGRTAIIRILYLDKQHRGKKLGPVIDGLFEKFKELGFTHAEGWSYPPYAKHLAKRYSIEPKILVFHESLDLFLSRIAERRAKGLTD